jgi:hypothetical protein
MRLHCCNPHTPTVKLNFYNYSPLGVVKLPLMTLKYPHTDELTLQRMSRFQHLQQTAQSDLLRPDLAPSRMQQADPQIHSLEDS